MKIPPNTVLYQDFVLNLHNKLTTIYDIRHVLEQLDEFDDWAFILPKRLLNAIKLPYDISDMPYDDMLSEVDSSQAILIYQHWDAVMVKKIREPLQ